MYEKWGRYLKRNCDRQRWIENIGWEVRQTVFCLMLLVALAGCESIERMIGISTSEESSSAKAISPIVEGEDVQETIFAEPGEISLPSVSVIRPQELGQALAEGYTEDQNNTFLQELFPKKKKIIVPALAKTLQDIYFAFDEATILPSAKPMLEANAHLLLRRYKNLDLLVEGHCDERGSMEYNLVLGARRAQAVKAYLVDLGIHQSRVRIISYGEERLVCSQARESCWQRNRRVHFVLQ